MELELVAGELYSLPRDRFTAARNAAAKQAREQGERELAEQISGLRRPSTAAWVANLLAREQPEEIRALVELGDGLRAAQQRLQGDELRRLSQQRQALVHGLVQQAQALARTAGHPVSDSVSRELVNTFTAAVNSPTAARALAAGRLTTALDPADAASEAFASAELLTGSGATQGSRRDPDDGADPVSEAERLRRDLERWRTEAADADAARERAERALSSADQAAETATGTLQRMRERLEAAEQAEHEARRRARAAQRDLDAADRAAREAHRRVDELQRRLSQHDSG